MATSDYLGQYPTYAQLTDHDWSQRRQSWFRQKIIKAACCFEPLPIDINMFTFCSFCTNLSLLHVWIGKTLLTVLLIRLQFFSSGLRCFHIQLSKGRLRPLLNLISQHDVFCQSHFKSHHVDILDIQRHSPRLLIIHAPSSRLRRSFTRYFPVFIVRTVIHLFHHWRIRSSSLHHHNDDATSI